MGNMFGYFSNDTDDEYLLKDTIMSLFPEEEYEALDYIMYQLSICYYGNINQNSYLILNGSNGKIFLKELIKHTFTNKNIKFPISNLLYEGNILSDFKFNILHYSEPTQNIKLNYNNLIENSNNMTNSLHLITSNYNVTINSNKELNNVLCYNFKHTDPEHPVLDIKYEKKYINKVISNLAFKIDLESQFKYILFNYYDKLMTDYDGDINNVPNDIINMETDIWKHSF
jgi:hypothetical protein